MFVMLHCVWNCFRCHNNDQNLLVDKLTVVKYEALTINQPNDAYTQHGMSIVVLAIPVIIFIVWTCSNR